ncbi:MAG TPA: aldo/keto reductase [Chthonomonadaceae bacterium]|nr:aldo/keto reductase [Chthonomonadaceae bacterium]
MEYRVLGKTEMKVSALGFGASPLGGVFGEVEQAEATRTVHEAIDLGINFFDVAPFYGITKAETVLGRALQGVPRDRYMLATKVGRYGMSDFDFSAERTVPSVEESLQRLQVETIDLIQCHDIEFGSLDQIVEETLPALRTLQSQGKVRYVGITGLPLQIYPVILSQANVDTVLSYCHYTLYDTSLSTLLPYLQSQEVGIINASPLAMGLLTNSPPPDWHPAPETLRAACAMAAAICRSKGVDIAALALSFSLQNPSIATTLVGIPNREQLRRNVACVGAPPDAALLTEIQSLFAPVHNLTWPSGRPENND